MTQRELPRMFRRITLSGIDPARLKMKTVAVFGVGGIGALIAEMLARVGIGKLILVDKDLVEEENMNRLGFYSEDLGKPKVQVLKRRLESIAELRGSQYPLTVDVYFVNIFDFELLDDVVKISDCIMLALDDLDARLEVNSYAIKHRKVLIDGGASTNGLRGRITVVKPFEWPCLGCYYSDESIMAEGQLGEITCNVSLPTTMALIASLQVDQCLKVLLDKEGVVPLILVNLEEEPRIVVYNYMRRRKGCEFCGGDEDHRKS